jgi:2-polyprenyl-3-methyl-5-hydroxy-6-metoxy-1,4-benzoquinol methylase
MQTKAYEYEYAPNAFHHHHAYLMPSLTKLLKQSRRVDSAQPKVLDLGCGDGSLSQLIAQAGYEVTGVEESPSGIECARQNAPNLEFIQASIYDLPESLTQQQFDIVIAAEVIEHLMYPRDLLRTAKRCLKSGGRLVLTTPYHGYLKNLALALSGQMDQHYTVLWDGGHVKFFSVKTLISLLETEGYTDISFKFAGRMPYLWKSMLCSCIPQ